MVPARPAPQNHCSCSTIHGYNAMGEERFSESLLQGHGYGEDIYLPTARKAEFGSTSGLRISEARFVAPERPFHTFGRTPSGSGLVFAFTCLLLRE